MRIRKTTNKKLKKITELTIERENWAMGGHPNRGVLGSTRLLNEKNKMCCLGFMCHAAGAGRDSMYMKQYPQGTRLDIPLLVEEGEDTTFAGSAVSLNDDTKVSRNKREKNLKTLFKRNGVKLKFTGKYPEGVE